MKILSIFVAFLENMKFNNEWVSSHLLDRDEFEPDLYYAQLEPPLMSRPPASLP